MPPIVIDLTSSPEPDHTSCGAAVSALQTFEPRKSKGQSHEKDRAIEHRAQDVIFLGGLPCVPSASHVRGLGNQNGQSDGQIVALSRPLLGSTAAKADRAQVKLGPIRKNSGQAHHHRAAQGATQPTRAHTSSVRAADSFPAAPYTSRDVPSGIALRDRQPLPSGSNSGASTERSELLWALQSRKSNGDKHQAPEIRMVNGTAYIHTTTAPAPNLHAKLQHSRTKLPDVAAPSIIVSDSEIDHGKALKRRRVEVANEETHFSRKNAGEYALSGSAEAQQSVSRPIALRSTPPPSSPSHNKPQILNELEGANHDTTFATARHDDTIEVRSPASIQQRDVQNQSPASVRQKTLQNHSPTHVSPKLSGSARSGKIWEPYTAEEDALLKKLKEVDKLSWEDIFTRFGGRRTYGSLQVRYSTKIKSRGQPSALASSARLPRTVVQDERKHPAISASSSDVEARAHRARKKRNNGVSATADFISWADVKKQRRQQPEEDLTIPADLYTGSSRERQFDTYRAYPRSLQRALRQREMGDAGRSLAHTTRSIPEDLKEGALDDIGPRKFYKGTSGDVTCLAWAPNGNDFATASIAITDDRSMQYNRPKNLIVGRAGQSCLYELPEHHVARPSVDAGSGNVNGLHSMRESQDSRLFMTVASVQFSPCGSALYSGGTDRKVRAYQFSSDNISCAYELDHSAPLDLLSVSNLDVLATACHQSDDGSIGVYRGQERLQSLSPGRTDEQTKRSIYPSALKWGLAYRHSHLLLAGFSIDSFDEERNIAGETCLWDVSSESRIPLNGITRNVFDVAWNPLPSSSSTVFAVASSRGTGAVSKGTRSVVQCFAPGQNRARRVLQWECPALDINDVIYCQHDDNLMAAGATDGKVYIWDQRFANASNAPLHTLVHGESLNVLDHDRDRETADTGVRFVSWGATSSRLYTGSSDGVVKVWNPYRSSKDAHIKDVATFGSAVMSGALSPDYRDLLMGEDQGRVNLLSVGYEGKAVRSMQPFDFHPAPISSTREDPYAPANELISSGQIALRPMGALPIRQAVQGPNYHGPYLATSINDFTIANRNYQAARDAQHKSNPAQDADSEPDRQAEEGAKRRQAMQDNLEDLRRRLDDARALLPRAQDTQKAFHLAEDEQQKLRKSRFCDPCKLECNYLPVNVDDDDEVPDSRRSEMRIPWIVRAGPAIDSSDMTWDEAAEYGLTTKCISCLGPALKPRPDKQPLCGRCRNNRLGLTAKCRQCSSPISTIAAPSSGLCERCDFACFRCGQSTVVSGDASQVTCNRCELTWLAGVLGYELLTGKHQRPSITPRRSASKSTILDAISDDESLGFTEIEHYASQWQTRQ